jgi:hypothetical protein
MTLTCPSLVLSGKTITCPAILPGFCNNTSVAMQQYLGYLAIISGLPGNNVRVTYGCLVIIPGLSGNIVRVVWQKNQGWLTIIIPGLSDYNTKVTWPSVGD